MHRKTKVWPLALEVLKKGTYFDVVYYASCIISLIISVRSFHGLSVVTSTKRLAMFIRLRNACKNNIIQMHHCLLILKKMDDSQ